MLHRPTIGLGLAFILGVLVHATFPLQQASEAHRVMESSSHIGKLVLTV